MRSMLRSYYDRILVAAITAVDPERGVVSISFMDQWGERSDVPIPVIAMSRNSWFRAIPDVNDLVMVGMRPDDSAVILGWFPANYIQRVQAFENDGPNAVGGDGPEMLQKIRPGEFDLRSKGGAYFRANNIGDWLFATPTSRVQMFGLQGLVHHVQAAHKITDGKSWQRFGTPYRFFPALSDRELPVSGLGLPIAGPSDLRERSVILYDAKGNILIQEAVGDVVDESGILGLSGYTSNGAPQQHSAKEVVGKAASTFTQISSGNAINLLNQTAQSVVDTVKDLAQGIADGVKAKIAAIKASAVKIGNSILDADLVGIVDGGTTLAGEVDGMTSTGVVGKRLRYRLLVNKDGKLKSSVEIDENGNIVQSSNGEGGYTLNANKGSLSFYGLKGIKLASIAINSVAKSITETVLLSKATKAGTDITRDAGGKILDSGVNVGRSASGTLHDYATTSITIESDGTVSVSGTDVTVTGSTSATVSAPTVTVTAATALTAVATTATITTGGTILNMTGPLTTLTTPIFNVVGVLQVNGTPVTVP